MLPAPEGLHEAGLVERLHRHLFVVNPDGFTAVQEFLAGFWAEHLGQLRATLAEPGDEAGTAP